MSQQTAALGTPMFDMIESQLEWFEEKIQHGTKVLTAGEVLGVFDDICIGTRTRFADLPSALRVVHADAKMRDRTGSDIPFVVRSLIDSFSRAQAPATAPAQEGALSR